MKVLVAIVGYNRPKHILSCINSLERELNNYSGTFDFIPKFFIDGLKSHLNINEKNNHDEVKKIVSSREYQYKFQKNNLGLREHIFTVLCEFKKSKYDCLVLLEDDIKIMKSCLNFYDQMLRRFQFDKNVIQVSGYSPLDSENLSIFFNHRLSTWGWATWKEKLPNLDEYKIDWSEFDSRDWLKKNSKIVKTMPDIARMFKYQKNKIINAWSLDLLVYMVNKELYTLYPSISLIENIGHDGSGENCRKKIDFKSKVVRCSNSDFTDTHLTNNSSFDREFTNFYKRSVFKRLIYKVYDFFRV